VDVQDQPGFRDRSLEELDAEVRASQAGFGWDDYLANARGRVRSWRPALEARARAGMHDDGDAIAPLVAPETLAAAFHGVTEERPSVVLGDIRCPVLLVAAEETLAQLGDAPLQRFRAALPDADVVTLASSHDLLADALEETVAAVGAFVRSL
jgi:hypothetical protein